jgi:hypothetical protein
LVLIHGTTDVVPDCGSDLPFVDEAGTIPVEDQRGIDRRGLLSVDIDVEEHLARCLPTGGLRLARCLGALDDDRAVGCEELGELGIYDARSIARTGRIGQN